MKRLLLLLAVGAAAGACDDDHGEPVYEQCESYCTVGSGFPCPCTPETGCADDSTCGTLEPDDSMGICLPPCESDTDCVVHLSCDARPLCVMENHDTGEMHCGYTCDFDEECPKNMFCRGGEGDGICSPLL